MRSFLHNGFLTLELTIVLGAVSACQALDDINRTGGNSDKGYFEISPDANLAKGAHLVWTVKDYETFSGGKDNIDLSSVKSEDENVAKIVDYKETGSVEIKGNKVGNSRIHFTAKADDDTIDDRFSVRVVDVTDVKFLPCATNGAYARGEEAKIQYRFNDSASKDVLGLGLYPISFSPDTGITLNKNTSTVTTFSLFVDENAPSTVNIRSTLSGDDSELALFIVDPDEYDSISATTQATAESGQTMTLDLRPLVNGRPVCSAVRRVLRSEFPEACSISGAVDGKLDTTAMTATVSLDAVGYCVLSLAFPGSDLKFSFDPIIVTEATQTSSGSHTNWDD
jgi:hypothetical protein